MLRLWYISQICSCSSKYSYSKLLELQEYELQEIYENLLEELDKNI